MRRMGLRQRLVLQLLLVAALLAAADNVRVPVAADAAGGEGRGGPNSTVPRTSSTVTVPASVPVTTPATTPISNSSSSTTVPETTTTVPLTTTTVAETTTTVPLTTTTVAETTTTVVSTTVPETSTATVPETTTTVVSTTVPETTTTVVSTTVAETTTTTIQPRQAPTTTVATSESITNSATVLSVERTDGRSTVIIAQAASDIDDSFELSLRLASAIDQTAIDLGYVSVQLAVGGAITSTESVCGSPISIRLPSLPRDGVVATSIDEVMWQRIPALPSRALGDGQTVGYFVDADKSVVILTTCPTTVGIRKQRPQLQILGIRPTVTPRSANKLEVAGQAGDSPIVLTVRGSDGSCAVTKSGVFLALEGGECTVSAMQGGGSMYMSAESDSVVSFVQRVGETASTHYRTSAMMVLMVIALSLFLLWQVAQTFVDVRRALHTDPEKL